MSPKTDAPAKAPEELPLPGKPHQPVTTGYKIFADLLKEVIKPEFCCGCGTCVASCPVYGLLGFVDDYPRFVGKGCVRCGVCYDVCPRSKPVGLVASGVPVRAAFAPDEPGPGSGMGPIRAAYTARTTVAEIAQRAQDGGVVTALLVALFEAGHIDGAIVCAVGKEPWRAEPKIIRSAKEAVEAAGTRYSLSPSVSKLKDTAVEGLHSIAVVGTPCQMEGLRRMEAGAADPLLKGRVAYAIGIFCMENFHYTLYSEFMAKEQKIDLRKVVKMNISSGKFRALTGDGEHAWPVKDLVKWARRGCHYCFDLTAEAADIAVGSIGSAEGRSTVLVRTRAGRDVWDLAVKQGKLEFGPVENLELLEKLNRSKKKGAREAYEALQGAAPEEKPAPKATAKEAAKEQSPGKVAKPADA